MALYKPRQVVFEQPPVVEVALSLQSPPVPGITTAHFGLFWNDALRKDYPLVQEQPPIVSPPDFAENGIFEPQVFFGTPSSRHWYLSNDYTRLVQVQQDRLVVNWRKLTTTTYPHYDVLREEFVRVQSKWTEFLRSNGFPIFETSRVEVTYINHLAQLPLGQNFRELGPSGVFRDSIGLKWPANLGTPEDLQVNQTFKTDELLSGSRLVLSLGSTVAITGQPVLGLNLVFRAPGAASLGDCMSSMDLGHNQITNSFADLMNPTLKEVWGQKL